MGRAVKLWLVFTLAKSLELENDEKVNLIGSKKCFDRELVFQF